MAFSPDSQLVATADFDGTIRIWDIDAAVKKAEETGLTVIREPIKTLGTDGQVINGLAFSSDGGQLGATVPGRGIFLWDASNGELLKEIPGIAAFSSGLAFSPDGRFLASPSDALGATIRDAESGEVLFSLPDPSLLADISFSQDSKFAVTAAKNGTASLWNLETGQKELTLTGRASGFNFIAFHPEGRQLATGGGAGLTHIWDVGSVEGSEHFSIAAHEGGIHDALYSPDGRQIASTGEDGAVKLWDANDGRLLHNLPGQKEWVHFPAFSPDSQRLAAANRSGGVTVWDANSGQELFSMPSLSGRLSTISFSPDGTRIVAAGEKGLAHIWDGASGINLATFQHDAGISRVLFSHDGSLLWTFDYGGLAVCWDPTTGERLSGTAA